MDRPLVVEAEGKEHHHRGHPPNKQGPPQGSHADVRPEHAEGGQGGHHAQDARKDQQSDLGGGGAERAGCC